MLPATDFWHSDGAPLNVPLCIVLIQIDSYALSHLNVRCHTERVMRGSLCGCGLSRENTDRRAAVGVINVIKATQRAQPLFHWSGLDRLDRRFSCSLGGLKWSDGSKN